MPLITRLCLQEVDKAQLRWLRALLGPAGFEGCCSLDAALGGGGSHGLALFWDAAKATAVGPPRLTALALRGDKYALMQRLTRRAPTTTAGSDAAAAPSATFVLVTTHLKAGMSARFEEDRARQAAALVEAVDSFAAAGEAVAAAGDLNAHPTAIGADNDGRRLEPRALDLLYERGFRCAHREVGEAAVPAYSNWSGWEDRDVKATFDHVLLRGDGVVATAALRVPSAADVAASACRLPNPDYPSDHVSLVVEVRVGGGGGETASRLSVK